MRAQRKHPLAVRQSPPQVLFPGYGDRRNDAFVGKMHHRTGLQRPARKILPRLPDQSSPMGRVADLMAKGSSDVVFHSSSILPKNAKSRPCEKRREENEPAIRHPW